MRTRAITAAAAALATTLALAGCSAGNSMSGMPGMGGGSTSSARPSSSANDADIAFAMNMTMHHQQAIEMSDMVLAKSGVDQDVTDLATKIKAAQTPEIKLMKGWLKSWGQSTDMSGMDGMSGMSGGMMSASDMEALQNASGAEASTLFLTQMIQHHQGAIDMAKKEVRDGKNKDAVALAEKIVADQTAEIATMKDMLATK